MRPASPRLSGTMREATRSLEGAEALAQVAVLQPGDAGRSSPLPRASPRGGSARRRARRAAAGARGPGSRRTPPCSRRCRRRGTGSPRPRGRASGRSSARHGGGRAGGLDAAGRSRPARTSSLTLWTPPSSARAARRAAAAIHPGAAASDRSTPRGRPASSSSRSRSSRDFVSERLPQAGDPAGKGMPCLATRTRAPGRPPPRCAPTVASRLRAAGGRRRVSS